jgi:hypothetical protein
VSRGAIMCSRLMISETQKLFEQGILLSRTTGLWASPVVPYSKESRNAIVLGTESPSVLRWRRKSPTLLCP